MTKNKQILGLNISMSSIGYSVLDRMDDRYTMVENQQGVVKFKPGIVNTTNGEESISKERSESRLKRNQLRHKRVRKISLIKILIKHDMCPSVSENELNDWKKLNRFPVNNTELNNWLHVDAKDKNPYFYRHLLLTEKLDMTERSNRYILGRALYHIAGHRGYNPKIDGTAMDEQEIKDTETVKKAISELNNELLENGKEYLGDYFYQLHKEGKKIRGRHTDRKTHYINEFNAIMDLQEINAGIRKELYDRVFFQLSYDKFQKRQQDFCTLKKKKNRCPISHPGFEEFRMLSLINNIKMKTPDDDDLERLSDESIEKIKPLFLQISDFTFEKIAKKLAGKNKFCHVKDDVRQAYIFNYRKDQSIAASPVTAGLVKVFGENWVENIFDILSRLKPRENLRC